MLWGEYTWAVSAWQGGAHLGSAWETGAHFEFENKLQNMLWIEYTWVVHVSEGAHFEDSAF